MATNEKQNRDNAWKQPLIFLLLGAFLATSGSAATTWLTDHFKRQSESQREHAAQTVLLSAFQAEVEVNIINLNAVFSNYESEYISGRPLPLSKIMVSTTIFKENAGKISQVNDPGLIAEIVAFYTYLDRINSWHGIDSPQDAPQQVALTHASQVANFLHAAFHLRARLASRTKELGRSLSTPSFNEQEQNLLRRIQAFRQEAGARPPKDSLDFHGETRKPRLP